jgi:hypothetical protein
MNESAPLKSFSGDMYSLVVGTIQVAFSSAVITVSRDITHHAWRDDVGAYARQQVQISQEAHSATVTGLSGARREMGPHLVQVINPGVFTETELARHLAANAKSVTAEDVLSAMAVTDYDWGKLVEVDWTALDFEPGGRRYFLLPHEHPVIDLAGLKLDWPSIIIQPA